MSKWKSEHGGQVHLSQDTKVNIRVNIVTLIVGVVAIGSHVMWEKYMFSEFAVKQSAYSSLVTNLQNQLWFFDDQQSWVDALRSHNSNLYVPNPMDVRRLRRAGLETNTNRNPLAAIAP